MCNTNVTWSYPNDYYTNITVGTFEWALTRLKQGHKVRRKSWADSRYHVYLRSGKGKENDEIVIADKDGMCEYPIWYPLQSTLLATDWEIYVKRCGACGQQTP